jgi:hypothetical protein
MQVVFQILSTFAATMAVVYAENLNVRPVLDDWDFGNRVDHVKNDGDSVFVVLTDKADIGVG